MNVSDSWQASTVNKYLLYCCLTLVSITCSMSFPESMTDLALKNRAWARQAESHFRLYSELLMQRFFPHRDTIFFRHREGKSPSTGQWKSCLVSAGLPRLLHTPSQYPAHQSCSSSQKLHGWLDEGLLFSAVATMSENLKSTVIMILVAVRAFDMDLLKCRAFPWSPWGQRVGHVEHRKK